MAILQHTPTQKLPLIGSKVPARLQSGSWIQAFVLFQIACQLALLVSDSGLVRAVVRFAVFGASLFLLVFLRGQGRVHPAGRPARWVLAIVGLSILHPMTNSLLSGVTHAALYVAILAPLFWVARLRVDISELQRVVFILWAFNTLSATIGVLQVYFPGKFEPYLTPVIATMDPGYIEGLYITTAGGYRVFRPMGLTNIPGGAAAGGFYAVLFGIGFLLISRRPWLRAAAVSSMTLGMMCLYLSQVRVALVMLIVCLLTICGLMARRGAAARLAIVSAVLTMAIGASLIWAISIGGQDVTDRLATLVQDDPRQVYYVNRGHFLEETIAELLPLYPLGAGLGRWGMVNAYLGDDSDPERAAIWVEIQWTGWLVDGGVPLILAYVAALFLALWTAWRIALSRATDHRDNLWLWGALLFAYNVGALAVTFSYPLFIGQGGLEFWLLNAVVFSAARGVYPLLKSPRGPQR